MIACSMRHMRATIAHRVPLLATWGSSCHSMRCSFWPQRGSPSSISKLHRHLKSIPPNPRTRSVYLRCTGCSLGSSETLSCRAVLAERPLYPAFAPDNFPTVRAAALEALQLAERAVAADSESAVAARDLAYAKAAVVRWPASSALGAERDAAEVAYSDALKAFGKRCLSMETLACFSTACLRLQTGVAPAMAALPWQEQAAAWAVLQRLPRTRKLSKRQRLL